jgi:hypothetical protein
MQSQQGHHHSPAPALGRPTHSECSHCPPSQCASLIPCSVSGFLAPIPSRVTLNTLPVHDVVAVRMKRSPHSITPLPPTPPPQLIA